MGKSVWQVALIDGRRQNLLEELCGIAVALGSNPLTETLLDGLAYSADDDGSDDFDENLEFIEAMLRRLIRIGESLGRGTDEEIDLDGVPF